MKADSVLTADEVLHRVRIILKTPEGESIIEWAKKIMKQAEGK